VSWSFARSPKWIVRHVLVVLLLAFTLWAAFWQLRRLDEKRESRDLIEQRLREPVADVTAVLQPEQSVDDPEVDASLYRRAVATGTYLDDETLVVENRSYNGSPGGWILTPLELDDGSAVVVNRGFLGLDEDARIVPPAAPEGEVVVSGIVFPSQEREGIGRAESEGELEALVRADVERIQQQVEPDLLPAYLQMTSSDPPEEQVTGPAPALLALGEPEPDLGPHLSYAVQWFVFTTIAGVGYLVLLRKVAQERAQQERLERGDELDREIEQLVGHEP